MISRYLPALGAVLAFTAPLPAQHSQVSSVVVDPLSENVVWIANRDNDSISRVDYSLQPPQVTEIQNHKCPGRPTN